MDEQANGRWDVVHATDEGGLVVTIADLHRLSTTRAIVDPDSDGSRGEMVSIAQVLALSRRWDQ